MASSIIEMGRNPRLTGTTNDGGKTHTLDVNAVVNLGDVEVSASQAEGPTGDPVPTSAMFIGTEDTNGDLQGVSEANPLPVTGTVTVTLPAADIEIGAVELKDGGSNNRAAISAGGLLSVDGSAVTQPISAAALPLPSGAATAANQATVISSVGNIDTNTSGLSRAEDSAAASGDKGVAVFFIQKSTPADLAGDGDYAVPQFSAGRIWGSVKVDTALPAGSNVIGHVITDSGSTTTVTGTVTIAGAVTNDGTFAVQAAQSGTWNIGTVTTVTTVSTVTAVTDITNNVKVVGPTAADAALTAAPVTIGGRATNANPTNMSAAGDVVNAQYDLGGRVVTIDAPRELNKSTNTSLSNTTSETTIIAATSGVFHDVFRIMCANTGVTASEVSIRDDTGGTVRETIMVPAGETRGFAVPAGSAVPQTASNKNWTAQCASTTTAMKITAQYVDRV